MASSHKLPITPNAAYGTISFEDGDSSRTMKLRTLVDKHSQSLPLLIQLEQGGYYGPISQLTLCTEDQYQVHCVKYASVISVQDSHGTRYSVPLYSAFKVGLIYASGDNGNVSPRSTFPMCSDILSRPVLPKVVCATKQWHSERGKPSIQEKEVLIVLGKQTTQAGREEMVVFSLLTQNKKLLPAECLAHFTTDPACNQLHLAQIVEHVPGFFPCQAFLYFDVSALPKHLKLPSGFLSKPFTLVERKEEVSLLLSPITKALTSGASPQLLDIPVSSTFSDIEVSIVASDTGANIYPTDTVMQDFDVKNLLYYKEGNTSRAHKIQSVFYMTARDGFENAGISLVSSYGTRSFSYTRPKASSEDDVYEEIPEWSTGSEHSIKACLPIQPVPAPKIATGPKPQVKPKPPVRRTKLSAKTLVDSLHTTGSEHAPAEGATSSTVTARKENEPEYTYMQPLQDSTGSGSNVRTKPQRKSAKPLDLEDRLLALESRLSNQEEALAFEIEQRRALTRLPDIPPKGSRSSGDNKLSRSLALPSHAQSMKEKNQSIVSSLTTTQVSCVPIP